MADLQWIHDGHIRQAPRPGAKLTPDDVLAIRSAHKGGETQRSLAERYGVTRTSIANILHGVTWKVRRPKALGA